MVFNRFASCCIVFLTLGVVGCGGSGGSVVSGKVTYDDGSPVSHESADVKLVFADEETGLGGEGEVAQDGTYSADLLPGKYKVALDVGFNPPTDENGNVPEDWEAPAPIVAEKFLSTETSGLVVEVNGATTFDVQVSKP